LRSTNFITGSDNSVQVREEYITQSRHELIKFNPWGGGAVRTTINFA